MDGGIFVLTVKSFLASRQVFVLGPVPSPKKKVPWTIQMFFIVSTSLLMQSSAFKIALKQSLRSPYIMLLPLKKKTVTDMNYVLEGDLA